MVTAIGFMVKVPATRHPMTTHEKEKAKGRFPHFLHLLLRSRKQLAVKGGNMHGKFPVKKTQKPSNDNFFRLPVELRSEGDGAEMGNDFTQYNEIYREMADLLGNAAALKIWNRYSGLTISFPRQLYSKEYVRRYVEENEGILKPAEMARKFGLSERRVRQIIHEVRDKKYNDLI